MSLVGLGRCQRCWWCQWMSGGHGKNPLKLLTAIFSFLFSKGATSSHFSPAVDFGSIQPHSAFSEANFSLKTDSEVILSIFVLPPVSLCPFWILLLSFWFSEAERIWIYCAWCRKNQTQTQFLLRQAPACLTLDPPHWHEKRHGDWSRSPLEGAPDWRSEGQHTAQKDWNTKWSSASTV